MAEKGFPNQFGAGLNKPLQRFQTYSNIGSHRAAADVSNKSFYKVTQLNLTINSYDPTKGIVEVFGHPAREGDLVRIVGGEFDRFELEILEVIDTNRFLVDKRVLKSDTINLVGIEVQILRGITALADRDGNVNFSPGPTQFVKNGNTQVVTEDTNNPSNNEPLPVKGFQWEKNGSTLFTNEDIINPSNNDFQPVRMSIMKDGDQYPVNKDTTDPKNTVAVPVEIVKVDGTEINITAGDIDVQLSDKGLHPDITRIGDGDKELKITDDDEVIVHDGKNFEVLEELNLKSAGSLVPELHDEIDIEYVPGESTISKVRYSFEGVQVTELSLTYDASGNLTKVLKA